MSIPVPPFDQLSAEARVRLAEDAWNSRDPDRVIQGYSEDSFWRNRSEFLHGRSEIVGFLRRKWLRERDYRLIKELWCFAADRIAVRFVYEYHDASGNWFRAFGNENWKFASDGLMVARHASINELAIRVEERKFLWDLGCRPNDHPGLTALGL